MTPRYTTSGKRFIGPRVDPATGQSVFPLPYAGRRQPAAVNAAVRDLECRVRAAGMQ